MKILVLSRYDRRGPSSRYRFYQFKDHFERRGLYLYFSPLFSGSYLINRFNGNWLGLMINIITAYWRRLRAVINASAFDVVFIEKELFPWFPALVEEIFMNSMTAVVIDLDDAVFHRYDRHESWLIRCLLGSKFINTINSADTTIAGNSYLARYAERAHAERVCIIPTVVDLDYFRPRKRPDRSEVIIGWTGSISSSIYLSRINKPMEKVIKPGRVDFHVIGGNKRDLPEYVTQFFPWSEEGELELLRNFDIGLMPLADTPWEWGKCGLKILLYMALGIPVIASPVGVNRELIDHGVDGFLAKTDEDWITRMELLIEDETVRVEMGQAGREKVKKHYCIERVLDTYSELFLGSVRTRQQ